MTSIDPFNLTSNTTKFGITTGCWSPVEFNFSDSCDLGKKFEETTDFWSDHRILVKEEVVERSETEKTIRAAKMLEYHNSTLKVVEQRGKIWKEETRLKEEFIAPQTPAIWGPHTEEKPAAPKRVKRPRKKTFEATKEKLDHMQNTVDSVVEAVTSYPDVNSCAVYRAEIVQSPEPTLDTNYSYYYNAPVVQEHNKQIEQHLQQQQIRKIQQQHGVEMMHYQNDYYYCCNPYSHEQFQSFAQQYVRPATGSSESLHQQQVKPTTGTVQIAPVAAQPPPQMCIEPSAVIGISTQQAGSQHCVSDIIQCDKNNNRSKGKPSAKSSKTGRADTSCCRNDQDQFNLYLSQVYHKVQKQK